MFEQIQSSKQILDDVTASSAFYSEKNTKAVGFFFFRYPCNTLSVHMVSLKERASVYAIGWSICLGKSNVIDKDDYYKKVV